MKELYSENLETVSGAIDELFTDEQKYKSAWAMQVRRNVAFANGDQNPYPIGAPVIFNNQPMNYITDSRTNTYQTNEIEPIIKTLVSYMTRQKPTVDVSPADADDPAEKNIARIGEKVQEAKWNLDREQERSSEEIFWSLTTGTIFRKDYWDYTLGEYLYEIDGDGNIVLDPETGEAVLSNSKTGSNNIATLTGMTVSVDHSITDFDNQPYVGETYVMDVDWAREAFDRNQPGYTGKAPQIKEDGIIGNTIGMLEDMKFAIPYISSGTGNRPRAVGKCLIREWNIRPNRQFPRGRYFVKAGDQVVFDSYNQGQDLGNPYFMELDQIVWHPLTHFQWEPYIGRFLGKSLVEQLIPLQMRLNEINGAILENANTLAKPNIMAAHGQLIKGTFNGQGANIYKYYIIPGASPPFVLQGAPLPAQFFKERQEIIDQMVRIAGTNFVMQGGSPTGVTAASAIQQLLENANNQQADGVFRYEQFKEKSFTKKLRILHKFHQFPDKNLDRYIKTLCKDETRVAVQDFVGIRDLSDGIVVNIESGSMVPKSESAKAERIQQAAQGGLYGPVMQDPSPEGDKARNEILKEQGLKPLNTTSSIEIKKAEWENSQLMKGIQVPISEFDVAAIHLPCHITKIQDPIFLEQNPPQSPVYMALYGHIQEHQQAEQQKAIEQQAQMLAQQQAAMPPPSNAGSQPQQMAA